MRNPYNKISHLNQDTILESDKIQENITHKRTKRSALFQQVTTRLQGTDKTVLLDFSLTVKAAPHECVIRTSQPEA